MDYNTYMNRLKWNGGYGNYRPGQTWTAGQSLIDARNNAYQQGQEQAQQWQNEGWVNPSTLPQNDRPAYAAPVNTDPTIAGVQGNGMQPQVMPGTGSMVGQTGSMTLGIGQPTGTYTPPPVDPNSATAQNPFLNLGLNAFTNTQGPYDPTWLNQFGQSLWNQANQNWNDTINPSLNSAAITAGGYGGDRAALAKGVAADRLNQSVFNALAPAALQDYNQWQNRALQGGQSAAGVGQGLEQLDLNQRLGYAGLNNQQYGLETQRQLGMGDLAAKNLLTEAQVAQMANQTANPQYTNPFGAAIGGGLLGWQVLNSILNPKG